MSRLTVFPHLSRTGLGVALALASTAWMAPAVAQSAPAASASTAHAHADMAAMGMSDMPMPASAASTAAPATGAMPAMDHAMHGHRAPAAASSTPAMPGMDHGAIPVMQGMPHGPGDHAAEVAPISAMGAMPAMDHAMHAGHAPAAESSPSMADMPAMDHGAMPVMQGMPHGPGDHAAEVAPTSGMGARAAMDHAMRAGHAPAAESSPSMPDMPAMDHAAMPGMQGMPHGPGDHAAEVAPTSGMGATPAMDHAAKPGMQGSPHGPSDPADERFPMSGMGAMPAMDHAMHGGGMAGMPMGAMQGGSAPPHARSPDYSDGYRHSTMPGMDMADSAPLAMLQVDRLEAFHGRDGSGQAWDLQGWVGRDADKLWLRSEGERRAGRLDDGDVEALWSHAVAPYWDSTLGLRHDLGEGPSRDWLAAGVQGLAPYWFEVQATLYLGASGRSAARVRASYEVLFTQRLILQPELEANFQGRRDPARGLGRGLTDVQFGLRLRYEVRREFAPYVGVQFVQRIGGTADLARAAGRPVFDRQLVAGLRFWF
ncbi:MAG TPA: copper resistance protein B [Dyella sp.]|nr:copper resistance protein B [Dyella sp.]